MQSLVTHGVMGFSNDDGLLSGHIETTLEVALRAIHGRHATLTEEDPIERVELFQTVAQIMSLLDRPEDAAEYFDRCVKHIPREAKGDLQSRSCLIAGLQCLGRNQLRTAWSCLQRALDTKGVPLHVQVGSCAAMAALLFRLGMRRPAANAAQLCLEMLGSDEAEHATPRAVLKVLQTEFVVLDLLRQHERLDDLAFWPRDDEMAGGRVDVDRAIAQIAECRKAVGSLDLLSQRLDFLTLLLQIAYKNAAGLDKAMQHIERMSGLGLSAYAHTARHELALACIAVKQVDWLRRVMNCYATGGRSQNGQQHNFKHDYCLAKLGELSGRDDLYIKHYRLYATQALIQVRRTCAYITVPASMRQAEAEIPKDDIASRLPSRYRRAYQFILANLSRENLSIKEVAEEIGLTERALQLAFRAHVGMSPSAVIRQCRMERIREELKGGAVVNGATTLDVAQRWGVRSRSALAHSYKDAFGELPSQSVGGVLV
jgi:AraC-like DNA-binding protein